MNQDQHWKDLFTFSWIHIGFTFVTVFLFFTMISCTEDPKAKKAPLGPEYPVNEVEKTISKAMGDRFVTETKVGDAVLYELNRRVETSDPIALGLVQLEVLAKEISNPFLIYHLIQTSKDFQSNPPKELTQELEWKIYQTELPGQDPITPIDPIKSSFLSSAYESLFGLSFLNQSIRRLLDEPEEEIRTTFHNLSFTSGMREPPPILVARENCGGLEGCMLKVNEVNYDVVSWKGEEPIQTIQVREVYATNTPYLGHLVLQCLRTLQAVEDRDYYVSQCQVLRDFKFGRAE